MLTLYTSFDFTVYWSATTDLTNTWTLEWGVDTYTTSTTVAPNNSTELTVTPNGTNNLQITTIENATPFGEFNLETADLLTARVGRWNTSANVNTGNIIIYAVRLTPNF